MVAGRQLRHALAEAMRIIRMTPCEHKIGICRCPYERFHYYQEPDSSWSPWLMALLASTATREAASFMEASLILQLETNGLNIGNNRNWTTSCDYGGEGPNRQDEAHLEQYVYLAVKPLPLSAEELRAAASAPMKPIGDITQNRSGTCLHADTVNGFVSDLSRRLAGPNDLVLPPGTTMELAVSSAHRLGMPSGPKTNG